MTGPERHIDVWELTPGRHEIRVGGEWLRLVDAQLALGKPEVYLFCEPAPSGLVTIHGADMPANQPRRVFSANLTARRLAREVVS